MSKRGIVLRLLAGQGVNGFGDGLWFSIWAIFFTRVQDIPAESMGLAIGIGGVAGFLAAVPVGTAADRYGPREVLVVVIALRGLASVAYIFAGDFWSLLIVSCCYSAVQSSGVGVRVSLVYQLLDKDDRLRVLAQGRVVQHIAYAAGAGVAMLVLADGRHWVFIASILVNASTFLVTAVLMLTLPSVAPTPVERQHSGTAVLRDLPYLSLMSVTSLLALCWALLSSGLPLWIMEGTSAPLWTVGLAVAVSSLAIALFQVRVTRQAVNIPRSVRASRISALALAACCVIFAMAAWAHHPLLATLIILTGMGAHIIGELYFVSSRWGLSLGFMVKEAEGQYQGLTAATESGTTALGPALVTALVSGLRETGWVLLGVLFLLSAAPVGPLARWAGRDPRRVVLSEQTVKHESVS
ncbi:MFS transporter [Streptomyces sp. G5(2025)]|uniref:MFS transporter n=1 Tax=Streptomyces sp. G5(2025) TaxID=3406628 RepID=UPI003C25C0CF